MQLATWLGNVIESGEVVLFTNDIQALQLKAENRKIEFNALDKNFLREIVASIGEGESIKKKLGHLKQIAFELMEEGITFKLSYKGNPIVTLGSEAKPKLSHLVTRTKAIEINDFSELTGLVV